MNDFDLPIIKGKNTPKRILSMDEYFEFVEFNLKYTVDKEACDKQKKLRCVDVPFSFDCG